MNSEYIRRSGAAIALCAALVPLARAEADNAPGPRFYAQTNLVSDGAVSARFQDPNLKNGWGVAFNPNGFVWVADNGSGVATLYDGQGTPQSLVVTVPGPGGGGGAPTGIVFNGSNNFVVSKSGLSGPARFIFATEDGTIDGWAPNVDPTNAVLVVDNSAMHAIYKGLALAANGQGNFLYATDFHNGRIDVFDATFKPVSLPAGAFADPQLPAGFGPFGIHNILGNLYVTYAKQDADRADDVAGRGLGVIDVFDPNGKLIRRFAHGGSLNAPWGVALAPSDFGRFSNSLLVGNFGDGRITAFDPRTAAPLGQLRNADGRRLAIPGLWGIAFGNGILHQPTDVLFFAAGPNDEKDGVYGRIEPVAGDGRFESTDAD